MFKLIIKEEVFPKMKKEDRVLITSLELINIDKHIFLINSIDLTVNDVILIEE